MEETALGLTGKIPPQCYSSNNPLDTPVATCALILAAGESTRFKAGTPKVYHPLSDYQTILEKVILTFSQHEKIDVIQVVINKNHIEYYQALAKKNAAHWQKVRPLVIGGPSRQESARIGLKSLAERRPKYVLIHDAARPFVSPECISRVVEALKNSWAVDLAQPSTDSLRIKGAAKILTKDSFYLVQTPQGFHYPYILALHERYANDLIAGQNMTIPDDISLCDPADIAVVAGEAGNQKITYELPLAALQPHIGMGADIHAFERAVKGNFLLKLGAVDIPHEYRLKAYSDGDVLLHALANALFSSAGLSDIGTQTDPAWKPDFPSKWLIEKALNYILERGGHIGNVVLTVIGEQPIISGYRTAIIGSVSQMLNLPTSKVGLNASTTEKLGFLGNGEGLTVQAVVIVFLPNHD